MSESMSGAFSENGSLFFCLPSLLTNDRTIVLEREREREREGGRGKGGIIKCMLIPDDYNGYSSKV